MLIYNNIIYILIYPALRIRRRKAGKYETVSNLCSGFKCLRKIQSS